MLLTDKLIKNTQAVTAKQVRLSDAVQPGLYLLIGKRSKTFYFIKCINRKRWSIKLGDYPEMTVSEARFAANNYLHQLSEKE